MKINVGSKSQLKLVTVLCFHHGSVIAFWDTYFFFLIQTFEFYFLLINVNCWFLLAGNKPLSFEFHLLHISCCPWFSSKFDMWFCLYNLIQIYLKDSYYFELCITGFFCWLVNSTSNFNYWTITIFWPYEWVIIARLKQPFSDTSFRKIIPGNTSGNLVWNLRNRFWCQHQLQNLISRKIGSV